MLILILFAGLAQSCEKKDELKGKVDFSIALSEDVLKKSMQNDSINENGDPVQIYDTWHMLVSAISEDGLYVLEDELIPLYAFGSGFMSEKIELETGKYQLVKFMVVAPNGEVIYAAPIEGSAKAFLVNDPLPVDFVIRADQTNHVSPEVLPTGNSNPQEFGYASFGFQVVQPIIVYVMVVDDNPIYMRPSSSIPAILSFSARDGWSHTYKIEAGINKILVKSGYDYFKVLVENPDYPSYSGQINIKELWNSSEDNPVIFYLGQESYNTLTLQPGPDEGKDAMITDLNPMENFGNHPYFEASFITEPVLTVMRTKRSLIDFDLNDLPKSARIESVMLTLTFETPIWDSLWEGLDNYMLIDRQLVLQQIVEPWSEEKVNWDNQPETVSANQVFIPLWDELSTNLRTYDVTSLFVPYQEIAAPNYGMMLKLALDNSYPGGWQFASSDYDIPQMRPRLTIKYSLPV